ncbi:hypothetical protein [Bradyrhizobium icense]|uniref:Uncharacterized protein n=1 Tax=Bradyrhizobium icense TaxID=1274631 RepID=A0A1B1UBQ6_9BRAD|nr:hypothetical protein [Bradyrhizobium icense]ANW00106.1 hypothetical protein LMTR13_07815 [Bradyrhizobium icense]
MKPDQPLLLCREAKLDHVVSELMKIIPEPYYSKFVELLAAPYAPQATQRDGNSDPFDGLIEQLKAFDACQFEDPYDAIQACIKEVEAHRQAFDALRPYFERQPQAAEWWPDQVLKVIDDFAAQMADAMKKPHPVTGKINFIAECKFDAAETIKTLLLRALLARGCYFLK